MSKIIINTTVLKGPPYLFDGFVEANLEDMEGHSMEKVLLNYNGYSDEFEHIRADEKIIEVDANWYHKIIFNTMKFSKSYSSKYMSDTTVFTRGLNPDNPSSLYLNVFEGDSKCIRNLLLP